MTKKKETKEDKRIRKGIEKYNSNAIYMLEGMMRGLMESEINPKLILIALHNVCSHGTVIEDCGGDLGDDDKILGEIFDGFEKSLEGFKKTGL